MADESPKKPIKRAVVPKVAKDIPLVTKDSKGKNSVGQNLLLLVLLGLVGSLIYLAIFKRELLTNFIPTSEKTSKIEETSIANTDSTDVEEEELNGEDDEVSTIIGEDKFSPDPANTGNTDVASYPLGSKFYLISGTFVFYPYAEKYRDKLNAEGFNARILSSGSDRQYHRIYIETSSDIVSIRAKRDNLRNSKGMNVWIYAE